MAAQPRVVLDDRLLIEELLVGLPSIASDIGLCTTSYWYYRACRAAVAGARGHLSGPFERLRIDQQERAILDLLHLRADITLANPRVAVLAMAEIAIRHPQLNLLNLEAVAAARTLAASVRLTERSAAGILPSVLDSEGIEWAVIELP